MVYCFRIFIIVVLHLGRGCLFEEREEDSRTKGKYSSGRCHSWCNNPDAAILYKYVLIIIIIINIIIIIIIISQKIYVNYENDMSTCRDHCSISNEYVRSMLVPLFSSNGIGLKLLPVETVHILGVK